MNAEYDVETPVMRVNVYRGGRLVAAVLCESADDAADVVAEWEDVEGIECELEDLASRHGPCDVRTPEPEDFVGENEYRADG
jgi:hypothetical protein